MRILLSYLLTQISEHEPDTLDYVFVYWLLGVWQEEFRKHQEKAKELLQRGHRDNFNLEVEFTSNNLIELGIVETMEPVEVSYDRLKSQKIDHLVNKQFGRINQQISNQILNALNTNDTVSLEQFLKTTLKKTNVTNSLVSSLMRIYRTENTMMRSKLKVQIQEDLARQGIHVTRRWLHTLSNARNAIFGNYIPRDDHMAMQGVAENHNGYFTLPNGVLTKAPGMCGLPEEDINCRCDVYFTID